MPDTHQAESDQLEAEPVFIKGYEAAVEGQAEIFPAVLRNRNYLLRFRFRLLASNGSGTVDNKKAAKKNIVTNLAFLKEIEAAEIWRIYIRVQRI